MAQRKIAYNLFTNKISEEEADAELKQAFLEVLNRKGSLFSDRNKEMAERLLKFEEPIVCRVGAGHIDLRNSKGRGIIQDHFVDTTRFLSLTLAGGYKIDESYERERNGRYFWEYQALAEGRDQQNFLAADKEKSGSFVLHQAQIGRGIPLMPDQSITVSDLKKITEMFIQEIQREKKSKSSAKQSRPVQGLDINDLLLRTDSPKASLSPLDFTKKNPKLVI